MKKAFGLIEVIIGIILIGVLSELIMGISQGNKIHADSIVNLNNHILLDSEIEQARAKCVLIGKTSNPANECATNTSNSFTNYNGSWNAFSKVCNITYNVNGIVGNSWTVNSICTQENQYLFNVNTTITNGIQNLYGEGYVSITN